MTRETKKEKPMKSTIPVSGALAAAVAVATMALTGCATTSDVDKRIAEVQSKTDKKIESVETQVEELQEQQKATDGKVDEQGKQIEQLGQSAAEALKRAQEAGVLAKGKVVFQQSFTEDRIRFKTASYELTKDAKGALDEFAGKVKEVGKGVYLEIQGHTDDTGDSAFNDMLGQQRAEAVRRYLSREHKLPLGRMSTISYGDTLPIESNKTAKGRSKNRRVVIVVLE
jgi:peptidoglycan-associated lipoprotein